MKKYLGILVLTMLALQLSFAGDETKHTTLNVKGMTCSSCVFKVKNVLSSLEGVQKVDVSLEKGTAEVTYLPAKLTSNDLLASIDKTGFNASVADEPQDQKKEQKKEKMGGEMQMEMPMSPEMDQARVQLQSAKEKLAKDGKYSCCISPSCNFCAVAMNMCPCGMNVTKGQPVCGECKGGWMSGFGAIPDVKPEDVKMMPPDKAKMGYEMKAKMMNMAKEMKKEKK